MNNDVSEIIPQGSNTAQDADNTRITEPYGIAKNKELAISGKDIYGKYKQETKGRYIEKDNEFTRANFLGKWNKVDGNIKTDDVVRFSRDNKYNATHFHKVYDGGVDFNGEYFDYPIDEMVFNPGAQKYILPHGVPKWKVFGQLPNKYNQINYHLGYIPMPTLVTRIDHCCPLKIAKRSLK